ncbi:uncharacterized protein LOC111053897 [Nilaparvata lugens]|uniref:uncharacterized protein LOC111053897 n=1 Tax=Nilaparvata lugens TaxID=108931 RepID=UPI00193C8F78|nr:uncharacterized protein LOC111053897 [Nilaparvata lugens]
MFTRESGTMMYEENQNRFDTNKSTKGASKLRRDLINAEITNLRDLLPLPPSTRQRLSQLQLMALVCVYVRKANYFQQGRHIHHYIYIHHIYTLLMIVHISISIISVSPLMLVHISISIISISSSMPAHISISTLSTVYPP